jgi:HEAT repeat protein
VGLFRRNDNPTEVEKRKQAAWELGKTVDVHQIALLQKYWDDKSAEVRRAAVSSLEQQWPTGDAIAIGILTEKLRDSDSQVRATAALALGEFITCAKTPGAKVRGSEAIQEILRLLAIEQEDDVLNNMVIALGNVDDPAIVPSFSAAMGKVKKSTIYLV